MKIIKAFCFAGLCFALFVVSCTTTSAPSQTAETSPTTLAVLTKTPAPTPLPSIPATELPLKHSDASQWRNKLQGIKGKGYMYDSRDVSPDGRWFVTIDYGTFLLRLIPLDNSSQTIEYQIEPGDIHDIWVYSWAPDSSAFLACVNYAHNPNGCQAIKVYEVLPSGTLKEHNIAWAGDGFQVLWYGTTVTFVSSSSGIFQFDFNGSLSNNSQIRFLVDSVWAEEGRRDLILAIQRPYNLTTLDFLPSTIYEVDRRTLEASEIYKFDLPVDLLGEDSEAKYFLFEEFSSDPRQSVSIDLFELATRAVIQRYIFPPNTEIGRLSSGNDQIAFDVKTKNGDKGKIWVFDFKTRSIEIRGTGTLMGWLYPNEGFLVRDDTDNWTLLAP
jgi:hypothetical protein